MAGKFLLSISLISCFLDSGSIYGNFTAFINTKLVSTSAETRIQTEPKPVKQVQRFYFIRVVSC